MDNNTVLSARRITVSGLVQGVGFRPFVYRLAKKYNLSGWVENRNNSVEIHIEGTMNKIRSFIADLETDQPAVASISELKSLEIPAQGWEEFLIRNSRDEGREVTEISPDIAVCSDCLEDMKNQPHRLEYPFINCTNCGPRFSIIRGLPYDRANTTMDRFIMCDTCSSEYHNVDDRRFHAQPVACTQCGPHYELFIQGSRMEDLRSIIRQSTTILEEGGTILAKGLGGFFLCCDALNNEAVSKLRNIKHRYGKPFAVMFRDIPSVEKYAVVSEEEKKFLEAWQRPVLLLNTIKSLAPEVSAGFPTLGAMLPYLPVHYLIFNQLQTDVLVFTSGNFSEEPIVIDDRKALELFSGKTSAILVNNRPIHNRVDDSVAQVVNGRFRVLRRSRGFVPAPVFMDMDCEGLVATGAELVNTFAMGKGNRVLLSQHIGDLKNLETMEFFEESFGRFMDMFRVRPVMVAHDLHPDYLSTRFAQSLPIPSHGVQHHHAHIASCMAENRIDEQVIGISLDGTGYGTDGHTWGSEFMIADLHEFERITHFEYLPMPGGDLAVEHPWRMAISCLYQLYGDDLFRHSPDFYRKIREEELQLVLQSIKKKINTPWSCGAGRVFDILAVWLGILTESSFHAEAPMRMEALAVEKTDDEYPFSCSGVIFLKEMYEAVIADLRRGKSAGYISTVFHNTLVSIIITIAGQLKKERGIRSVVLSGGLFQNKFILGKAENRLKNDNFKVYSHSAIPPNDGGISLGQLAILAKKRNELCV